MHVVYVVQVPVGLNPKRQQFLAIKWLIVAARERPGKGMANKLALELLDAYNNEVSLYSISGEFIFCSKQSVDAWAKEHN